MDVCGESILHIHINLSFTFCQEGGDKKEKDEKGKERIGLGQHWIFGERDSLYYGKDNGCLVGMEGN